MRKLTLITLMAVAIFAAADLQAEPIEDTFYVTLDSYGYYVSGGGSGFNGGTWYVYPSGWKNEWFYDHPFDSQRGKIIHIEFDMVARDPAINSDICFAVNWSTPEWSDLGYGDTTPPTPDLVGTDESLYIFREILLTICPVPEQVTHYVFDVTVWDYNPEWVSIDVDGENFEITNGTITHDCVVDTETESWGAVKSMYR
ncbi:MAG: hypothetical protein R6U43_02835 [Candidatus Krumholzibacteriales bacterium]